MNRNLLITAIALAILGIGAGAYFLFFRSTPSVTVAPTGSASLPSSGQITPGTSGTPTTGTFSTNAGSPVAVGTRLVQINAGPVVPGIIVTEKRMKGASATSTADIAVNFIERQSGNVFSYSANTRTLTRINNKTLPGVQTASWLPDASAAVVRYLSGTDFSTINSYSLAATSSNGFFLPQNLSDVAVSATGILSVSSGVNGSIGSLSRLDGTRSANVFTTPLTSIRASFSGKNQYLVFSKPSASLAGDAFLVGSTGRFNRIAGPLNGLVALASPTGKWMLVSYIENSMMKMNLIDTTTNTTTALPIGTIADKCTWTADETALYCGVPNTPSTAAQYPDDWYQGAVSFNDRIWKVDVAGRYAQLVLDFAQNNKGTIDAVALATNPSHTLLVFVNKNDGSLWSYSL